MLLLSVCRTVTPPRVGPFLFPGLNSYRAHDQTLCKHAHTRADTHTRTKYLETLKGPSRFSNTHSCALWSKHKWRQSVGHTDNNIVNCGTAFMLKSYSSKYSHFQLSDCLLVAEVVRCKLVVLIYKEKAWLCVKKKMHLSLTENDRDCSHKIDDIGHNFISVEWIINDDAKVEWGKKVEYKWKHVFIQCV